MGNLGSFQTHPFPSYSAHVQHRGFQAWCIHSLHWLLPELVFIALSREQWVLLGCLSALPILSPLSPSGCQRGFLKCKSYHVLLLLINHCLPQE